MAGDGILALFGVIEDSENPVLDAINTVQDMKSALVRFNGYLNQMYDRSFGFWAGINFGKVIVGNFNTGRMRKISAIGDEVNAASRIETANKDFDTQLLISQSAYEEVQRSVEIHKMHRSSLKGKSGEYVLYEIKI